MKTTLLTPIKDADPAKEFKPHIHTPTIDACSLIIHEHTIALDCSDSVLDENIKRARSILAGLTRLSARRNASYAKLTLNLATTKAKPQRKIADVRKRGRRH